MKKIAFILSMTFVLAVFVSCGSTPVIPADATATQLIQLGQDSLEVNNYKAAETYYNAVIMRYGMDTSKYVEAKYELGHMYLKQKKYDEAYNNLTEILDIFENAEFGSVPSAYKKLAQMELAKIPAKYIGSATEIK